MNFSYFPDIMPWIFNYLFWILPLCMGGIISIVETDARISFAWNESNPSFKNENGAKLEVPYLSNLVINCPYGENVTEYYKIYWVPEELFQSCYIPYNHSLEEFLTCDTPQEQKFFELFIIDFSSVFGVRGFHKGQNYYLATMSTGTQNGLNNLYGRGGLGACHNEEKGLYMKLNISVVDKPKSSTKEPDGTQPQTTRKPPTVRTTQRPTTTTSRRRPTTQSPPTSTKKATTKLKTTSRPPSTDIPDINSGDIIIDGSGSNSAIIDANDAARSVTLSSLILVLSICLSVFNFVNFVQVMR